VSIEDKVSAPGQDAFYQNYAGAVTDDLGEYRIPEVEPGKHYLAVEFNGGSAERNSGVRSSYRWPQVGGLVLYPDAAEMERAQQVEVAAGATLRLNDISLKIQRAVTISGHVKPTPAEPNQSLSLRRANGLALHSSPLVQGGGVEADGSFKMTALAGRYILTASDGRSGKISMPLMLEVGEQDVTGLELELTSGYEISGRIAVDGREHIDFSQLLLNFGGAEVKVDSGGAFRTNLTEGRGRYIIQGLPDDWFVEKVLVAGKQIEGKQFVVNPGTSDITLTLNPRGASVSVTPQGPGSEMTAMVALLRESGEFADPESVLGAQSDGSGKFTVRAVPPGSYRVFTLDASSYLLIMRPDVLLEKYRGSAPLITVVEGERKEITLPVVKISLE
jgi:hypothetical protein